MAPSCSDPLRARSLGKDREFRWPAGLSPATVSPNKAQANELVGSKSLTDWSQ